MNHSCDYSDEVLRSQKSSLAPALRIHVYSYHEVKRNMRFLLVDVALLPKDTCLRLKRIVVKKALSHQIPWTLLICVSVRKAVALSSLVWQNFFTSCHQYRLTCLGCSPHIPHPDCHCCRYCCSRCDSFGYKSQHSQSLREKHERTCELFTPCYHACRRTRRIAIRYADTIFPTCIGSFFQHRARRCIQ